MIDQELILRSENVETDHIFFITLRSCVQLTMRSGGGIMTHDIDKAEMGKIAEFFNAITEKPEPKITVQQHVEAAAQYTSYAKRLSESEDLKNLIVKQQDFVQASQIRNQMKDLEAFMPSPKAVCKLLAIKY